MNVGIIGSGQVAQTLASGFLKHGHHVLVGTREPSKLTAYLAREPKVIIGSFADAAKFGEVVVLAVKGAASVDALRLSEARQLAGKVVIDTTNPIADVPPVNGVLKYFTTLDNSLLERIQKEFSAIRFVKAFNSIGHAHMVNPQFTGGMPTMFICGNDESAKKTVTSILDQFGWETADMGRAEAARAIEPLCMLWCIPGFLRQQRNIAFKLLT